MKKLYAFIVLLLLSTGLSFANTRIVCLPVDDTSGRIQYTDNASYAAARDNAASETASNISGIVGQAYTASEYCVYRSIYRFDTSSLPSGKTIDSVKVHIVVDTSPLSDNVFNIMLCAAEDTASVGYFGVNCFNNFEGWAASGAYSVTILSDSIDGSSPVTGDSLSFGMNTTGKAELAAGGTTQFYILSGNDIGNVDPKRGAIPSYYEDKLLEDDSAYMEIWYSDTPVPPASSTYVTRILGQPRSIIPTEHWYKCSIDTTLIGGLITNFPVMVNTTTISGYDSLASAWDRKDVHFRSSTGTALKFEREQGNKNIYWVKVPAPYTSPNFFMVYGDTLRSDEADPTAVWDANFVMVQHMADSTTSITSDATSYGNIGTKKGANEPIQVVGQIGYAQSYDGDNDNIWIPANSSINSVNLNKFTISFRLYQVDNGPGGINSFVLKSNGYWAYNSYGIFAAGTDFDSTDSYAECSGFTYNQWQTLAIVFNEDNDNKIKLYIDGSLKSLSTDIAGAGSKTDDSATVLYIGYGIVGRTFSGPIDEVRISNNARSLPWIKAESNYLTLLTFTKIR